MWGNVLYNNMCDLLKISFTLPLQEQDGVLSPKKRRPGKGPHVMGPSSQSAAVRSLEGLLGSDHFKGGHEFDSSSCNNHMLEGPLCAGICVGRTIQDKEEWNICPQEAQGLTGNTQK